MQFHLSLLADNAPILGNKFSTTWRPQGDYIHLKVVFTVQENALLVCSLYWNIKAHLLGGVPIFNPIKIVFPNLWLSKHLTFVRLFLSLRNPLFQRMSSQKINYLCPLKTRQKILKIVSPNEIVFFSGLFHWKKKLIGCWNNDDSI